MGRLEVGYVVKIEQLLYDYDECMSVQPATNAGYF